MKKVSKIVIGLILAALAIIILVALAGMYKFNFSNKDIYMQSGGRLDSKDATYMIDGQPITLKNGLAETEITPDSASKLVTRYFGNDAMGDLNGDGKDDKAFLLTHETGGSGTFYYIAVALAGDSGYQGLNALLLGDRIAPQTTEIKDGKVIVNYADRRADEPMTASPSIGVSKYFQVLNSQLAEIAAPAPVQMANPASTNCLKQGGKIEIQTRGDGSQYGLCYFEDNRACEEWALMRGDCPLGGRKTAGFDTIDQKYCAWRGGNTYAVPDSICTFKDGTKCPTIDFYNGKCPAAL